MAQTILDLLRAVLRLEENKFQSTEEICTDGWLLEGDKINITGKSLMGDSAEISRH